ncbi:unnamed protein product, partial [Ectocarpus sp. 13 AM-2016]
LDALLYCATTHKKTQIATSILCYRYQPDLPVSAGVFSPLPSGLRLLPPTRKSPCCCSPPW